MPRLCRKIFGCSDAVAEELSEWFSLMWPTCVAQGFLMSMDLTDQAMLGHYLKGRDLPEASSATLVIMLSMSLLERGPSEALRTLSANAYAASQSELAGRRLQTAIAFTLCVIICVGPLWAYAGSVLVLVDSNKKNHPQMVNTFGRIRLFSIVASGGCFVLTAWLAGRKLVKQPMVASGTAALVNVGLNYLLIFGVAGWTGFGFDGSPLATALCRWFNCLCLLGLALPELRQCWPSTLAPSFSKKRVCDMAKLAIPMSLSAMLEDFNLQIASFMALKFGRQELAAHSVMLNAFVFLSCVMIGASGALGTRVSHHIVAGDLVAFRRVLRIAATAMFSWSTVVTVAFVVLQDTIGKIFSQDPEVWRLSGQLSILLAFVYFLMTIFYMAMGVLTGIAQPTTVMLGFVVGCYAIGIPCSYYFAFHFDPHNLAFWPYFNPDTAGGEQGRGCGILGVWFGLAIGYTVTMLVSLVKLLCIKDWQAEIDRARRMAELDEQEQLPEGRTTSQEQHGGALSAELLQDVEELALEKQQRQQEQPQARGQSLSMVGVGEGGS